MFVIDLRPSGLTNHIIKYADDTSLLVPEKADIDITAELQHVLKWAEVNELYINTAKTKELGFHRPNPRNFIAPDNIPGSDRVTCAKLLEVWLQDDLGERKHCDYILKICNQRLYLLNLLEKQGLPQLHYKLYFMLSSFLACNIQRLHGEALRVQPT